MMDLDWAGHDWDLFDTRMALADDSKPDPQVVDDAARLSQSFRAFIRSAWPVIDPTPLVDEWYVDAMADHGEAWARGEIKNLMIHIRPRMGKTKIMSVLLNGWIWTWRPTARVFSSSYGKNRTAEDARLTRGLILSPWYQARWPLPMSTDQGMKDRFALQTGGYRYTTIWGTQGTGDGGDYLIADDPQNADDMHSPTELQQDFEWFSNTWARRRDNELLSGMMFVCQRLGPRDLGNMIRALQPKEWDVVALETRKTIIDMAPYYRYLEDGTVQTERLPKVDTALSRSGRYVDPRQPGDLLSSRVHPTELALTEEGTPTVFASQEQQAPVMRSPGMIRLYRFGPANFASFAARMGCSSLKEACVLALKTGWVATVGGDHGIGARREVMVASLRNDRLREIWAVGIYVNPQRTGPLEDALAFRRILDSRGIQPWQVSEARMDVGQLGKGVAGDTGASINMRVSTIEFPDGPLKGQRILPFPVHLPAKETGSIEKGVELMNTALASLSLMIDESCGALRVGVESWAGGEEYKDIVDGWRYDVRSPLQQWQSGPLKYVST